MEKIKFINNPNLYNPEFAFVAHLSKIAGENELLATLNLKLEFPKYFGFNWDALSDCLRDFHWVAQKRVVLVHDDLPLVDNPI